MSPVTFPGKWARKSAAALLTPLSFIVFLFLDFIETFLCFIYRYLDLLFEGKTSPCYCRSRGEVSRQLSETLYRRKNLFREIGFLEFATRKIEDDNGDGGLVMKKNRWSDCGCESCVEWMNGDHKLHVVVRDPPGEIIKESNGKSRENVIFLHGFLSSSSIWTETVFRNLSESAKRNYRLFAVDLLGFGRSPKPRDCVYTLTDHMEMIEKSVICTNQLKSFHVVAHSMGCIIALALSAKYSESVRSVTLIAPPCFPSSAKEGASMEALGRLAKRRIWPLLLFGAAFMSWYEHLGRCFCFVVCRNHRLWEKIVKLLPCTRELHFMMRDLTKHTHSSAWHTAHNVIYGGAKFTDEYLESLTKSRRKICVIQGDEDQVVPLECCNNIKKMAPHAEINIVTNADHTSVILAREKEFTQNLERVWASVC